MELWAMLCRATQDGWVMVESFDKTWFTGEGNGRPLQYSCLEKLMNSIKRQKVMTMKDEFPRSVGTQNATGEERRNKSIKNEEMEPRWKQHPLVDVTGDGSKVQCYKEQYCTGTSNVRSMELVKHKMTNVNIDSLVISELEWTGMGKFYSGGHYIYYCGHESLRRNGVALIVNKRAWNAVLRCNLKTIEWPLFTFKARCSIL